MSESLRPSPEEMVLLHEEALEKAKVSYYLYILLCANDRLYTGIAKDPRARFLLHQSGKGAKYTRSNKPIKIVYLEKYASRSEALRAEARIKKMSKQEKEKLAKIQAVV